MTCPGLGEVTLMTGGFSSIILPATGPKVTQLLARSQICSEPVDALLVSWLGRTVVDKPNGTAVPPATGNAVAIPGLAVAIPEGTSEAEQLTVTFVACHRPSGPLQEPVGSVESRFSCAWNGTVT